MGRRTALEVDGQRVVGYQFLSVSPASSCETGQDGWSFTVPDTRDRSDLVKRVRVLVLLCVNGRKGMSVGGPIGPGRIEPWIDKNGREGGGSE